MKRQIIQLLDEIYLCITSFLLFILIRPILKISKVLFKKSRYTAINYFFIKFTNIIYVRNKRILKSLNDAKFDMRNYRDTYDMSGTESYLKIVHSNVLFKGKSVLDFGCGPGGKCLDILKYKPKKVLGIDLSARNIQYAKELINKKNRSVLQFQKKDILKIKKTDYFDTIISYTVFEHIERKSLPKILKKMKQLIKPNGNILIAFNHYNDKFGSHLKEYIYHPWPQSLFDENMLFGFWNNSLKNDKNVNNNSYYPKYYVHGIEHHNHDCLMNLNKMSIDEFEDIIRESGLEYVKKDCGTKFKIRNVLPFLPKKYLSGSCIYHLQKGV